jgi:hypothetical protein
MDRMPLHSDPRSAIRTLRIGIGLMALVVVMAACQLTTGSGTTAVSPTVTTTAPPTATPTPSPTLVPGTLHIVVNLAMVCPTYHCASPDDAWCVGGSSQDNYPSYTLSNTGQAPLSWSGAVVPAQNVSMALTPSSGTLGDHASQIVHLSGTTGHDFDLTFSWSGHSTSESVHCLLP